ncbi:LuxR C-terminal-related transcriptional regulator [Streptomyces phaeochromogenes]|uniref:LuxR C-terminal-related transcriptional regulator n=1 Tax=Streptomyces phaeochromogenes TaxID=1923 RepID=A0ABZ1HDC7_STRPH|nr:LuxR C-terminal-related transcriptional regulator [Streptomyces phaeochromogenes]WSD16089.1 LuxR C-terminal-related transcriptional regulator [Streptomyces phaeochromogenes]
MQQQPSPLVGRHGEVEDVAEALRTTGGTTAGTAGVTAGRTAGAEARTLLVTGGAGTGKTAVVEQARQMVVQEGGRVLRFGWESGEDPAGGTAALTDAVCGVLAKVHDGRLPARIAAVRRVQARASGPGGEVALLSTLGEVLADAAREVPFALILDNTERMPARTASALGLLLRTFRPAGVPVVMAGRPMRPGHVTAAQLPAAADRVLELPPLSTAEVGELVVRRLGRSVEPDLVTAVLASLGPLAGSPAAVLSVLASLEERGGLLELDGQVCLTVPEGGLRLRADAAELGRLCWPDVSPDAGTVAAAAVLAGLVERAEVRLEDLHRAKSPAGPLEAVGRTVDRLVADRVVTVGQDGRIAFAVPALAAALRTLPARAEVRSLHATITRLVTDRLGATAAGTRRPRLAGHVAAAGAMLDDSLAVPLLLAAAGSSVRFNQAWAVRSYHSVLRHLPPHDPRTPGVLHESAGLSLGHSDHIGVLALAEPLLACLDVPHGEERGDRGDREERGNPGDRDGLEWVTRACALSALHEHRSPYAEGADPRYRAALERVPAGAVLAAVGGRYGIGPSAPMTSRPGSGGQEPGSGTGPGSGSDSAFGSGPVPSVAEVRLVAAAVGSGAEFERARLGMPGDALGEAALDRLRNAAAYGDLAGALEAVLGEQRYVAVGESTAVRYHSMVRDYLTGDWDSALSCARRIETRGRSDGAAGVGQPARALAAEIQLMRGELGRAREWLDLIPDSVCHPLVARARLGVRYWSGQADKALAGRASAGEALEAARHDVRRARESGLLAGLDRVLLRMLSITVRGDSPEATRRTLEELEALYEEAASPMTYEAVLVARGMVHGDADSALAAYRLVRRRVDLPLSVDCCQCLTEVGDDPQSWLDEAMRSGHVLGMGRPVRSLLGAAARRRNVSIPRRRAARAGLTDREVRLIGMVSDGSTNRQIAARLACSEKTVEQRLSRLFQRTGCRSRVELAAAWLDGSLARQGLVPGH